MVLSPRVTEALADEIAEPRPDMNIKVAAFTVSEKSSNTCNYCRKDQPNGIWCKYFKITVPMRCSYYVQTLSCDRDTEYDNEIVAF